jgi:hypothetical protein
VLDPADDDLLIEIAAQLEQVVIRVPLIDLDQRTCTRRGSTQCESQRCLRSARGLLALLAPVVGGLCGIPLSFCRSPAESPMRLPSSPVASIFFESAW